VDTLIISTATAFIILVTHVHAGQDVNGIQLTQMAMNEAFGAGGSIFVAFIVLLFSFSSIIGNYYYGESNIEYITESKLALNSFRVLVIFMVVFGSLASLQIVWNLADIFMGFMALMNLSAMLLLRKVAFKLYDNYIAQLKAGKDPVFHKSNVKELKDVECWDDDHTHLYLGRGV
jgi:AGCS family alanine or glycine:cation symporter